MTLFLLLQATIANANATISKVPASLQTKILPTVVSGVLVFVLGQIILELLIKPYKKYKELKSEIAYSLVYYAYIYSNPVPVGTTYMISDRA